MMELFYPPLMALFLITVGFCFFIFKQYHHGSVTDPIKLPPGSFGWPMIGETLHFISAGRNGKPEKFITDRIKRYSPDIFKTSLFGEKMVVFCGPAGNRFLFSNDNKLVGSWWPRSTFKLFPFAGVEKSQTIRELLMPFLKLEALVKYIGTMDTVTQSHIEMNWEGKKEVKVFPLALMYSFILGWRVFVGIDDLDRISKLFDQFEILLNGILSIPIDFPGTPLNRGIKAANEIREELGRIIKQRKEMMSERSSSELELNDIMSNMLFVTDEDGKFLSDMCIADRVITLILAARDTVTGALTFLMKYLAQSPHVYNKVLTEHMEIALSKRPGELLNWDDIQKMKYSWTMINEVMRILPPLQATFREARVDFTYAGYTIPKGWKIYHTPNMTHRDPNYFANPEKFDPSRFERNEYAPGTFVPFGGGVHLCPGKDYARLQVLIFLHNMVKRFKWELISPNEKIIVTIKPTPTQGLPIRLYPYSF